MSTFLTFGTMSEGYPGTAPRHFICSTVDNLATITAVGYLNDLGDKVANNDLFWINYSDTTVLPAQTTATPGLFQAVYSAPNMSLVLLPAVGTSVGATQYADVTITAAALAGLGTVVLIPGVSGAQYKIRNMFLNRGGTNFSGGGGDRNMTISDGTTVYSIVPAATMQALSNAAWGATALPFPASAAIDTSTAVGVALRAVYQGGTADYTAGSLVLSIQYERVS